MPMLLGLFSAIDGRRCQRFGRIACALTSCEKYETSLLVRINWNMGWIGKILDSGLSQRLRSLEPVARWCPGCGWEYSDKRKGAGLL